MICIFELENNNYYIENTNNPEIRFQEHIDGNGSHWTRLYRPIKIVKVITSLLPDELITQINKYKMMYGSDRVKSELD